MKPGIELDTLIAEKVMGWKWSEHEQCFLDEVGNTKVLQFHQFSGCMADAWEVVEKLDEGNYPFILTQDRYRGTYSGGLWLASFCIFMSEYENGPLGDDADAMHYWANPHNISAGETAAHAICLAGLKVVGISVAQETSEQPKKS